MKQNFMWLVMAVFTAISVHIGYVLATPKLQMDDWLSLVEQHLGDNQLMVLEPALAQQLFAGQSQDMIWAVCLYDLSAGDVEIKAEIPPSYWLLSAYSESGDNFYSINDRQADLKHLLVRLTSADKPADETNSSGVFGENLAIRAPTARGLVVMEALLPHPSMMRRFREQMAASSCTIAPARS